MMMWVVGRDSERGESERGGSERRASERGGSGHSGRCLKADSCNMP